MGGLKGSSGHEERPKADDDHLKADRMSQLPEPGLSQDQRVALYEIAQVLAARKSLAEVFEHVVDRLVRHVSLDFASLMVLDVEPEMERVVGWYPADAIEQEQLYPRSRGRQLLADSYREGIEWRPGELRGRAERAMAEGGLAYAWSVPLMDGDEYYGVVTVAREAESRCTEPELAFLRAAGQLFLAAAREERAVWKAARDAARSALLTDLMVLLNDGRAPHELFEHLTTLLGQAVRFDHASLVQTDADGALRLLAEHPVGTRSHVAGPPVVVHTSGIPDVMRLGGRWLQFDPADYDTELSRNFVRDGLRTVNAVFLQHMGRLVGAIVLSRRLPRQFSDDDCEFLSLAATLLAQAIVNKEAVDRELDATRREVEEQRLITAVAAIAADEANQSRLLERAQETLRAAIPGIVLAFATRNPEHVALVRAGVPTMLLPRDALTVRAEPGGAGPGEFFPAGHEVIHTAFIRSAGEQGGVLVAAAPDGPGRIGDRELRVLDLSAQFIGAAMHTRANVERLEQGRALLQLVLSTLTDGIVLLDGNLEVAFSNTAGQVVIRALDNSSAFQSDGVEGLAQALRPALAQRRPENGEVEVVVNGTSRVHRYHVTPLHHPLYSLLILVSDVHDERTRQREREQHQRQMEQAARLSALGELVAGVAHELNNPLTAILGFSELLNAAGAPPEMHDDLDLIHKEASRARDIVRDLLFLVRPGEVEQKRMTLHDLVGHIQRLRAAAWRKQELVVNIDVHDGDVGVMGNEHQMTQVLVNLIANAEQALMSTVDGRLAIRAWLESEAAIVEVEDNGPGMDAEIAARIWEPFFTTKQGVGTGLGLTLSRSIVENHGGRLSVDSRPGAGTRFRVEIPREGARLKRESRAPVHSFQRRVLVVDDEPALRKLARRIVEALGHQCDVAEGVTDAVAFASNGDYDLVLCDYRIAAAVADEVLEALVEVAPDLVPRTVIATGAMTDIGVEELANRYGLRVLGKPYGMEEIAGLLNRLEPAA
jgi:signal transduction histidine kinase/ActR/RegA family two-component response regulator